MNARPPHSLLLPSLNRAPGAGDSGPWGAVVGRAAFGAVRIPVLHLLAPGKVATGQVTGVQLTPTLPEQASAWKVSSKCESTVVTDVC